MIFYDGSVLHSGHIEAPEKLTVDPLQGRLTLNGAECQRSSDAHGVQRFAG
jgi:hypothetical protein